MQQIEDCRSRTLLEMLAVLVLIGILTYGAMALFADSMATTSANGLMEEVRKRVLAEVEGDMRTNQFTYGLYNTTGSGAPTVSAYGHGLGATESVSKHGVLVSVKVPVGTIDGNGKAIDKTICKVLLSRKKTATEAVRGDIIELYSNSGCTSELRDCSAISEAICIEVKI